MTPPEAPDHQALLARALAEIRELRRRLGDQARDPIAVVGVACRFPGDADTADRFWERLRSGADLTGPIPADRVELLDALAEGAELVPYGAFLRDPSLFAADFFGISSREAIGIDPQQRILLETAWEAIECAGLASDALAGTRTGVFAGICSNDYGAMLAARGLAEIDIHRASGNAHSIAAGRISYVLGLTGPSLAVDTACSSSLVAVHLACGSLRGRECDLALAGGVNCILTPDLGITFTRAQMLARDGRCKTFAAAADGYVRGEGCGVVVLERLSDAIANRRTVWGVIRGSAVNQDGRTSGLTVPNGQAQVDVIAEALRSASVSADEVGYVEAHGTGTALGDPVEVMALARVFAARTGPPVAIGSVKTNIGHLEGAAGIAGLIKLILALGHRTIPPHLHCATPTPEVPWDAIPLRVATDAADWTPIAGRRIGGVSSFGFGGTNAHVVVEEAPAAARSTPAARAAEVVTLSAKSERALGELEARYVDAIASGRAGVLADIAYTTNVGRTAWPHRRALVGATAEEIVAASRDAPRRASDATPPGEVARRWQRGEPVDWRSFHDGHAPRLVPLPTYPFERERFWPRPRRRSSIAGARAAEHPLLGARLDLASRDAVYEAVLSADEPSFLQEHRIDGAPVVPAAAYVEMFLAAAAPPTDAAAITLTAVELVRPLVLAGSSSARVQLVAAADGSMSIASRAPDGSWRTHATARAATDSRPASAGPAVDPALPPMKVDDFYATLERAGIEYGPGFRRLVSLAASDEAAAATISASHHDERSVLDPRLLDAALQAAAAALVRRARGGRVVPAGIDRLTVFRRGAGSDGAVVLARLGEGGAVADIAIETEDGQPIATIERLRFAPLASASDAPAGAEAYAWTWERAELDDGGPAIAGPWLVVSDDDAIAAAMAGELARAGRRFAIATAGDRLARGSELRWTARLSSLEDCGALLGAVRSALGAPIATIVRVMAPAAASSQNPLVAQQSVIGSLLPLVRAAAGAGEAAAVERLVVVTNGASAVDDEDVDPALGTIAPFLRTAALEIPTLHCRQVDFGADAIDVATLVREVAHGDLEPEVCYRAGGRSVARFDRVAAVPLDEPPPLSPHAVVLHEAGTFDEARFGVAPIGPAACGDGQVRIAVAASGLNFRDVLHALGRIPVPGGGPIAFGLECTGVVVESGAGVEGLPIGARVAAVMCAGSVATDVVIDAAFVAPVPVSISLEAAATIPLAFLTASYALEDVARIGPGDRVLVHAAAGGVGLAALQIARRAGARVYATASPAKWPLLRRLGVEHVSSSRTADFTAQVMQATGGRGVDVVLNSLGADFVPPTLDCCAHEARFVEIGLAGRWDQDAVRRRRPDVRYAAIDLRQVAADRPALVAARLRAILAAVDAGELTPLPHRLVARRELPAALKQMSRGGHVGKLVVAADAARLRSDRSYLITGGTGALGLATADWMVRHGARHLVLCGRTAREPREVPRLREAGARVEVVAADLADDAAVAALLALVDRTLPPLAGIVHAAGVANPRRLTATTTADLMSALAAKAAGAWSLHERTRGAPLDFFVCYGSIAAAIGAPGLAGYAAANGYLHGLARHRRALGLPATTIEWGPWDRLGMTAALDDRTERRHALAGLEPLAAAAYLDRLPRLFGDQGAVTVASVDWTKFASGAPRSRSRCFTRLGRPAASAPATRDYRRELEALDDRQRAGWLAAHVARRLAEVIGRGGSRQPDHDTGLFDLGVDSLMAVELAARLGRDLGLPLSDTTVFNHPTVTGLTGYLLATLFPRPAAATTTARPRGTTPPVDLDGMSEEEAERLLDARLNELS